MFDYSYFCLLTIKYVNGFKTISIKKTQIAIANEIFEGV